MVVMVKSLFGDVSDDDVDGYDGEGDEGDDVVIGSSWSLLYPFLLFWCLS